MIIVRQVLSYNWRKEFYLDNGVWPVECQDVDIDVRKLTRDQRERLLDMGVHSPDDALIAWEQGEDYPMEFNGGAIVDPEKVISILMACDIVRSRQEMRSLANERIRREGK